MVDLFRLWFGVLPRIFRTRRGLLLENLALRQQLAVLKRQHPKPKLGLLDKLFWLVARRLWSDWKKWLHLVAPETVARWHRAGFRLYWSLLCKERRRAGGKKIPREVRDLIFQMVAENATWGAPRIHGELRLQHRRICFDIPNSKKSSNILATTSITLRRGQEILAGDWYACYLALKNGKPCR